MDDFSVAIIMGVIGLLLAVVGSYMLLTGRGALLIKKEYYGTVVCKIIGGSFAVLGYSCVMVTVVTLGRGFYL